MNSASDTIVAPATAPGRAAVGIVRLSGPCALSVFAALFRPVAGGDPAQLPDRKLTLGTVRDAKGEPLDTALGVIMRAPHSFTGEDSAEFQCHGGPGVLAAVLSACLAQNIRLAEPGEFSRRAFLNGKMDLIQAEALCDLISAKAHLSHRLALRQLRGGLSRHIEEIRAKLLDVAAHIEAGLDFPDEEISPAARDELAAAMLLCLSQVRRMLQGYERTRLVREGARVVLAGRPNTGKSSIFNALAGHERAIVSPHPGTTRDTIEMTADIRGIAVTLVDTAGIHEAANEVEQLGIERSRSEIEAADLILHVTEASDSAGKDLLSGSGGLSPAPEPVGAPQLLHRGAAAKQLIIRNKADLLSAESRSAIEESMAAGQGRILFSAATLEGLGELEEAIARELLGEAAPDEELQIANARHAAAMQAAETSLVRCLDAFNSRQPDELAMLDLRDALMHLGEMLGLSTGDEILDRIFSTFCLGK